MAGSPYAVALGRLQPEFSEFLPKATFATLLAAKDPGELAKQLEATPYAPEIVRARASHPGPSLIEVAVNRTLVRRNRHAYEATPFPGRGVVAAYLGRWDIQNIELILSSKAQGRPVTETEDHLVSSREIPAGLYAGVMTLDDFLLLLAQPTVEATATALVRDGYGTVVLPLLDGLQRTRDVFPLVDALDREYYRRVREAARFFQGDEWVVRGILASEIDVRNVLLLFKGKANDLSFDVLAPRWREGGTIAATEAPELYGARGVPELAEKLSSRYPALPEGTPEFREGGTLTGYESALQRDRAVRELARLRTYPLSLSVIFAYLLRSEIERSDLRRIAFGKVYGLPNDRLSALLVSPRL